jgi:hypothetical protein
MKANLKGNSIEPPSDGWFYWDNEKWQFDEKMRTIKFHSEAEGRYKHLQKDKMGLCEN